MSTTSTILPGKKLWTEEELLRLPDDGRKWELVNQEIKYVPAGDFHDAIGARLIYLICPFNHRRGMTCGSQAGFWMPNENLRAPDVSFTRKERLPDGKAPRGYGRFAPDLCVEIISPSEEPREMRDKVEEYFASGASVVWHVFPEEQRVIVFMSPSETTTLEADDILDGGDVVPGFSRKVSELFDLD